MTKGLSFLDRLTIGLFKTIGNILCSVPRNFALFLGTIFAKFIYSIARLTPYRKQLAKNIKSTLPISEQGAKRIAKSHIISLTKNIVDLLRLPLINKDNIDSIVELKNIHFFEEAVNKNMGVILVSAHFGCWELLGAIFSLKLNTKLNVLVQRPTNPAFDYLFTEYRNIFSVNTYYNSEGVKGLRPLFRALENKECIGFLIDQHGESEDTFGDFFGKIVSIPSGPANFAYRTKAPVVPAFIKRNKNNRHEVVFFPPVYAGDGDKETEIHKLSGELYKNIEKFIKEKPDEWLWIYERWNKLSIDGQEIANNLERLRSKEFSYEKK